MSELLINFLAVGVPTMCSVIVGVWHLSSRMTHNDEATNTALAGIVELKASHAKCNERHETKLKEHSNDLNDLKGRVTRLETIEEVNR